jgi:hypothetical protein
MTERKFFKEIFFRNSNFHFQTNLIKQGLFVLFGLLIDTPKTGCAPPPPPPFSHPQIVTYYFSIVTVVYPFETLQHSQ